MGFNRKAFKSKVKETSIAQTVANATTTTRTEGTEFLKRKARAGYRLMPTMNQAKSSYYAPVKVVSWLSVEVEKDGETKMIRKPVFNSKKHLNTKHDIVEEYINFIDDNRVSFDNYDEINAALKDYKSTIRPSASRIAYALELDPDVADSNGNPAVTKMGRMEVKNSIWNQLMDYTRDNDAHEEDLAYDPFDGMDDGRYFIVKYADSNYKVTIKDKMPVPNEYLQMLENVPFLEDMLTYNSSDWDLQLEGLRNFDAMHAVNLFNTPEFAEIIQSVHSEVREQLELRASKDTNDTSTADSPRSKVENAAEAKQEPTSSDDEARKASAKKVRDLIKANPELKGKRRMTSKMTSSQIDAIFDELSDMLITGEPDDGLFDDE